MHLIIVLGERLLRRQTGSTSDSEQEGTTQSNKNAGNGNDQPGQMASLPPRLYPDLPRAPVGGFVQPLDYPLNQGPTPFTPFNRQLRPMPMMPPIQPRPMNPSERLQSQTFTNGLGRRLLSMVGIEQPVSNETDSALSDNEAKRRNQASNSMEDTMKALRNSTVLQQLNRGVHSIYGSLSKMYNETVQQQLNLLQERFKSESANSTNPWQQRMAKQVPQFFETMAIRVNEAQNNLNRVWQRITNQTTNQMNSSATIQSNQQQRSLFNPYDRRSMINNDDSYYDADMNPPFISGNFFNQIGRSLGFNNDPMGSDRSDPGGDLGSQMRGFWVNQVQPQIGMLRGQIARVWRDLTSSGMLAPAPMLVARNNGNNLEGQVAGSSEKSSNFIDNILKGLDMSGQDYALVEPKADQQQGAQQQQQQQQSEGKSTIGMQMQNRLINMQRDLNQLWNGLSNSLQNALSNVRSAMNPQPQFELMDGMTSSNKKQQDVDPAENEIDSTIKDLSKLQKEADVVHDVVQRQQQAQQQQNFGSRFRNFFNDVSDLSFDQLPNRFGDSMSRFGNAIGDFWHQIPRRWDNFVQNMRYDQPNMANAPLKAANDTQKP